MNTTEDRAYAQAGAQAESIAEMVAQLDEREAAKIHVRNELTDDAVRTAYAELPSSVEAGAWLNEVDDMRAALVEALTSEEIEPGTLPGFEWSEDSARERIQEDALSVEIRSGWYTPGSEPEPEEFAILLCTGGPAVRIRGELGRHNEPERAWLEYQDWGTPWQEYHGDGCEHDTLLTYCRQFYFGE